MSTTKKKNDRLIETKQLTNNIIVSIKEHIAENSPQGDTVGAGNKFCEWVLYNIFELREDEVDDAIEFTQEIRTSI